MMHARPEAKCMGTGLSQGTKQQYFSLLPWAIVALAASLLTAKRKLEGNQVHSPLSVLASC